MTQFLSLSSGSNGNCYYIGNESTGFLIDVGIGGRTIKKRLLENEIPLDRIKFVLVSHDHIDHIRGLGSLIERLHIPVLMTGKLHVALDNHFCTRGCLGGCVHEVELDKEFEWSGVKITSFEVPHDATQTVGYFIDFFGEKFTFMTDLGAPTDKAIQYASKATHLIVESNYDFDMLIGGSYTYDLKMRIMQGHGHLSNEQSSELVKAAYHPGLKDIYLCHLSENNNMPSLAYRQMEIVLTMLGLKVGEDINLCCLPRRKASELFEY